MIISLQLKYSGLNNTHKLQYQSFFLELTASSWSTYPDGKKGFSENGVALMDNKRQILSLENCKRSCDDTPDCNAVQWNFKGSKCYLKHKENACDDTFVDGEIWGNFYWRNCGKYYCSSFCIYDNYYMKTWFFPCTFIQIHHNIPRW